MEQKKGAHLELALHQEKDDARGVAGGAEARAGLQAHAAQRHAAGPEEDLHRAQPHTLARRHPFFLKMVRYI